MRNVAIAFAALIFSFSDARATTATANLNVNITIAGGCTVTGNTLSFGTQNLLSSAVNQTATIGVTCTLGTLYAVGLNQGANGSSVTSREMMGGASGTGIVNYALFADSAHLLNWGNTPGVDTLAGVGIGSAQTLTVFGQVPAQTTGSPGVYTDTILVTVTY